MNKPSFYRVRLLEDSRFGRQGETVYLHHEYAEALCNDGKAALLEDKSMTRKAKILKGGIDRARHGSK